MNTSRAVRKASEADAEAVWQLIEEGKRRMIEAGNTHQWTANRPSKEQIVADIKAGVSYLLTENGSPIGTWAFIKSPEPTYAKIYSGSWIDDVKPYYVIHRVAGKKGYHGVASDIFDWCFSQTDNLRIDTHRDNSAMRRCIERAGFMYCGIIHLDNGDSRLAYQWLRR